MSDLKNIKEKYSTELNSDLSLEKINQIKGLLNLKKILVNNVHRKI